MAVNSETLIYEFKIYCFCVFFGYLQFAFYLWICSRLTGTFFAGPLALPVFGVVGYSVIYALSAVGSINLQAAILFVILSLFIPPVIAALFEYFIRLLIVLFAPATSKQVKAA
jgi:phosphate/sulfate permease